MGQRQSIQTEDPIVAMARDINTEVEQEERKAKMAKQKVQMDQKLQALEETMFQFAEKYGEENDLTQLMIQLHGVALMMKEQAQVMEGFNTAYEYMFETLNFYDEMFKLQNDLISGSLETKYGLFARIKENIRMRRTIRNVQNRMQVMIGRISSIGKISGAFVSAMSSASAKMSKSLAKAKNQKTKKGQTPIDVTSASAQLVHSHLENLKNDKNSGTGSAPTGPSAPTSSSGGSSAGSTGGSLDDIL